MEIAKLLGKPIKVDGYTANRSKLTHANVFIEIDVSKELPKHLWINILGKGIVVKVNYSKVPYYYKNCLRLGHTVAHCLVKEKTDLENMVEMENERSDRPRQEYLDHSAPMNVDYGTRESFNRMSRGNFRGGVRGRFAWHPNVGRGARGNFRGNMKRGGGRGGRGFQQFQGRRHYENVKHEERVANLSDDAVNYTNVSTSNVYEALRIEEDNEEVEESEDEVYEKREQCVSGDTETLTQETCLGYQDRDEVLEK